MGEVVSTFDGWVCLGFVPRADIRDEMQQHKDVGEQQAETTSSIDDRYFVRHAWSSSALNSSNSPFVR